MEWQRQLVRYSILSESSLTDFSFILKYYRSNLQLISSIHRPWIYSSGTSFEKPQISPPIMSLLSI